MSIIISYKGSVLYHFYKGGVIKSYEGSVIISYKGVVIISCRGGVLITYKGSHCVIISFKGGFFVQLENVSLIWRRHRCNDVI